MVVNISKVNCKVQTIKAKEAGTVFITMISGSGCLENQLEKS